MSPLRRKLPRLLLSIAAVGIVCGAAAFVARAALLGWAVRSALRQAGADDIRMNVADVTLRRVVVNDVGFTLQQQPVAAGQVTVARDRWWAPSLGKVHVAAARVPVDVAALTGSAPAAAPATSPAPTAPPGRPAKIPAEEVSIDGQLILHAPGLEQALTIKVDAKLGADNRWTAQASADGPGVVVRAEAGYRQDSGELTFRVPTAHLDLAAWTDFVQRVAPVPPGDWTVAGTIDATAAGTLVPGKPPAATATVSLRGGALASAAEKTTVRGIEADVAFDDVLKVTTAPGQRFRVAEATVGILPVRGIEAQFQLRGTDRVDVASVGLQAMGGRITAEPFSVVPSRDEVAATFLAAGLNIEELLALAPDVPAKGTGRVDVRLPLRFGADGLQFGSGWATLSPGVAAEVQLNTKGLLTAGMSTTSPSYAVLSRIEGGLLRLKLDQLRLDVHPDKAPAGRSAQLRLTGAPVDESVKAPVTLDVNVNGPVERLLNLGLNARVKMGGPKP
jgi:hypothetical protein